MGFRAATSPLLGPAAPGRLAVVVGFISLPAAIRPPAGFFISNGKKRRPRLH
jgi:hypothetical protein